MQYWYIPFVAVMIIGTVTNKSSVNLASVDPSLGKSSAEHAVSEQGLVEHREGLAGVIAHLGHHSLSELDRMIVVKKLHQIV